MAIGDRLREERERLGMSQPVFAKVAGTTKQTLFSWESGKTAPDGFQLAALATAGADVLYILTGQRQGHGIGESAVHQAVLDAVDLLSLEKKVDASQLARAVTKLTARSAPQGAGVPQGIGKQINITASGPRAQAAGGRIINKGEHE